MDIVIDGRKYDLCFGFDALDYLDKVYTVKDEKSGIGFGYGLPLFISSLMVRNITALNHAIKAGTSTEASKPSNAGIEIFVAELLDAEKEEEFFNEIIEILKKQPLTRKRVSHLEAATVATQKTQKKSATTKS